MGVPYGLETRVGYNHESLIVIVILHVHGLWLYYSIRRLTQLQKLDMSCNQQLHTIPDWLGELTSLKVLYLRECNLATIPSRLV